MPSLDPENLTAAAVGGPSNQFDVITDEDPTEWTAVSDNPWLTVIEPAEPSTGDGTVLYAVAANAGAARSGSITITGFDLVFSVDQAAAAVDPPDPAEPPVLAPIGPGGSNPQDERTWAHLMSRYSTEIAAGQTAPVVPVVKGQLLVNDHVAAEV